MSQNVTGHLMSEFEVYFYSVCLNTNHQWSFRSFAQRYSKESSNRPSSPDRSSSIHHQSLRRPRTPALSCAPLCKSSSMISGSLPPTTTSLNAMLLPLCLSQKSYLRLMSAPLSKRSSTISLFEKNAAAQEHCHGSSTSCPPWLHGPEVVQRQQWHPRPAALMPKKVQYIGNTH